MKNSRLQFALKRNELSKSKYDEWVKYPSIESLKHIYKQEKKSYGSCGSESIANMVVESFKSKEPLIDQLSQKCLIQLNASICICFHSHNLALLDYGGDGMLVPTFIEIIHQFAFYVKFSEKPILENNFDKQFYTKYFWAFEEYCKIIHDQEQQKVA